MATTIDTYFDELGIDIEDLYEMSETEREQFLKDALRDLDADELEDLEEAWDEYLDDLDDGYDDYHDDLLAIINSDQATDSQKEEAQEALEDIDNLRDFIEDLSSAFADTQTELSEEDVTVDEGDTYNFAPSDPDAGQEYVIDATTTESASDDSDNPYADLDPHHDDDSWVDTDGDGDKDVQADTDGDGRADVDAYGDGSIDETDMLNYDERNASETTVNIDCDAIIDNSEYADEAEEVAVELASYDAETGTTRWALTLLDENGNIIYDDNGNPVTIYVTVKGFPTLNFTGEFTMASTDIADSFAPELLHRLKYNSNDETVGEIADVVNPNAADGEYYTIIDMADHTDTATGTSTASIAPTEEDFENGREYTVTYSTDEDIQDTLSLTFDDDTELDFSYSGTTLTITATNAAGETITITIENYNPNDMLVIDGGIITEEDISALESEYLTEIGTDSWTDDEGVEHIESYWVNLADTIYQNDSANALSGRSSTDVAAALAFFEEEEDD